MDRLRAFLILACFLSLNHRVICGESSILFLDSPTRHYLRHSNPETASLSVLEIGAAISVLLGFAPPSTLTAAGSFKLNEVLTPNPFDKPRSVLMLQVTGIEDSQFTADSSTLPFNGALGIKVEGDQRVSIQLPGKDEVSLFSLDKSSSDLSDKQLSEFATWLGGSYVEDASGPLNGELAIPMANGAIMRLHMSERADMEFTTSLLTLIDNIRSAMELHQVLTKSEQSPAELITGRFDGIKVLRDHYGTEGIARSGLELLFNSVSKIFDSLQEAYRGQIIGVIASGLPIGLESENTLRFTVNPAPSVRRLQDKEAEVSPEAAIVIAEVIFVRTALAWITGIILLIATILGVIFLFNMPLTKDTLLYSNVKLD